MEKIFQFPLSVYLELSRPVRNLLKNKKEKLRKTSARGHKKSKTFLYSTINYFNRLSY